MGITAFSTEQELSDTRISLNGKPKIIITNNSISFTRVYSPIKTCQRNFFCAAFLITIISQSRHIKGKKKTFVNLSHYNSNRPYNLILQVKEDYSACFLHSHDIYKFALPIQRVFQAATAEILGRSAWASTSCIKIFSLNY